MDKISVVYLEALGACEDELDWFLYNYGGKEYTIDELIRYTKY